jgi:hypothetical protein
MRKKIVSFSLWGDIETYTKGAIINSKQVNDYYPGWVARFYVPEGYNKGLVNELKSNNAEIVEISDEIQKRIHGLYWRFLPAEDPTVAIMLSRDCDCRFSKRERSAVQQWESSDKLFHIMRDHPWHNTAIMGGMWGCKYPCLSDISKRIVEYEDKTFEKGCDQFFLAKEVFPWVKDHALVHDEFFEGDRFPTKRHQLEFVGQPFDENNATDQINLQVLKEYLTNKQSNLSISIN